MSRRKRVGFVGLALAFAIFFLYYSSSVADTWRQLPQRVGLGEHIDDSNPDAPYGAWTGDPNYVNWNPKPDFKAGSPMPADHNYTSVLVIARTQKEDVSWIDKEIPDQPKAVYVADDPSAPLHPPKNKGHEVMVYLSYIIDHYDSLPDVSIFMHAHQLAWHNDDILGHDAADLVRRLSRPRVWREGFVNMRCSWYPGCPDWMHPGETKENVYKQEEILLAKSWSELFPLDKVPDVLAQPCCAQFALSRERIHALPLAQYVWYRNWLFNTKLPDHLSGRVWEYIWQFVFTGSNVYCPKEHICFCDQYGSCFGGEAEWAAFAEYKRELGDWEGKLRNWEDKKKAIEEAEKQGKVEEAAQLERPEEGKDREYQKEIDRLKPIVERLKEEARRRGEDPKNRAMEAGRVWHEGDGF
ncbi:uncharacterized protein EI97DRAFT_434558 [Westerdykella ornata]|uniref:DUF3431 domain-containing protein n=1 Tax=Westerdykella ornata TaxID=318751 RepID=A0A6A6JFQ4_WESOR|nr:uncharacterized protein EI97DRAFT_434558 [Westerdykella ornata]KAF2274983.1 hypothetical protein EI97DRAFT_434558 [Westerdykella ornata]